MKASAKLFQDHGVDGFRIDAIKHITWGWQYSLANSIYTYKDSFLFGEWYQTGDRRPALPRLLQVLQQERHLDARLPAQHGDPKRLRLERQLQRDRERPRRRGGQLHLGRRPRHLHRQPRHDALPHGQQQPDAAPSGARLHPHAARHPLHLLRHRAVPRQQHLGRRRPLQPPDDELLQHHDDRLHSDQPPLDLEAQQHGRPLRLAPAALDEQRRVRLRAQVLRQRRPRRHQQGRFVSEHHGTQHVAPRRHLQRPPDGAALGRQHQRHYGLGRQQPGRGLLTARGQRRRLAGDRDGRLPADRLHRPDVGAARRQGHHRRQELRVDAGHREVRDDDRDGQLVVFDEDRRHRAGRRRTATIR